MRRVRGLAIVATLAALPLPAAAQKAPDCAAYPAGQAEHLCVCVAGPHDGAVWGAGPYTADSDLCTAAVHAGVIGAAGGRVLARAVTGPASYAGTTAHNVTTYPFGAYPEAYEFVGAPAGATGVELCRMLREDEPSLTCACPPEAERIAGAVWGSGPYTADSNACTAAVHAGALGAEGGTVTIVAAPGLESYPASTANGVMSSAWGAYGASFEVRR